MPTDTTSQISDGMTFAEFALRCARAFGPSETTLSAPSVTEQLRTAARLELDKLLTLSDDEAQAIARADFDHRLKRYANAAIRAAALHRKYLAMLKSVREWKPPTPDHVEFKQYMQKEITDSIRWDCDTSMIREPTPVPPREWRALRLFELRLTIERLDRQHEEEVQRIERGNEWMAQLRASLNGSIA